MTWGRKNGDASNYASWLPVCTYTGMDSLLNSRYRMMADSNNAILSPVGAVWHYLRQNFPLMELYQTDESHPSVAGTYAAACSFYVTLFRKDPTLITYNSSLPDSDAVKIKNAARLMVYDSFAKWYIGEYDPLAAFNYFISGVNQITFTNSSVNTTTYNWNFGDGDTTSAANPTHQYATAGLYSVTLIATKCKYSDNITQTINVNNSGIQNQGKENFKWNIYPNPATTKIIIEQNFSYELKFKIYDFTGAEILNGKINEQATQIDISMLSEGFYFLQLFNNNKSVGQIKFVKESKQ